MDDAARFRALFEATFGDELTPTQAAVVLGCSPGAARVRLHRARQRLAREMQQMPKRSWPSGQDTDESQLIEEVSDDRA